MAVWKKWVSFDSPERKCGSEAVGIAPAWPFWSRVKPLDEEEEDASVDLRPRPAWVPEVTLPGPPPMATPTWLSKSPLSSPTQTALPPRENDESDGEDGLGWC